MSVTDPEPLAIVTKAVRRSKAGGRYFLAIVHRSLPARTMRSVLLRPAGFAPAPPRPRRRYRAAVHDPVYKLLFSLPRMVADLVRGFVPGDWAAALDFTTLEKLPAEYVGHDLRRRLGDMLWRVRFRDPVPRDHARELLVMLEFQSSVDPGMTARILSYTALVHQELIRHGVLRESGTLPPVLPIVVYNGERRWTAAVEVGRTIAPAGGFLARLQPSQRYVLVDARALGAQDLPVENWVSALIELENSASAAGLVRTLTDVFGRFGGPEARGFREALYERARHLPLTRGGEALPPLQALEGEDMATLLEARAKEWVAQWFQQGIEQGVERGRSEERALLSRLAARRFDAETAERLSGLLDGIADAERLAEVGESIIECETGVELLDRAERVSRRARACGTPSKPA